MTWSTGRIQFTSSSKYSINEIWHVQYDSLVNTVIEGVDLDWIAKQGS